MSILDILTSNLSKFSSNFVDVNHSIRERYAEFNLTTNQLCYKAIQSIGINKRVFIMADNSPFYIKWFLALSATNNVSIHIPPTTKEDVLLKYINKYKPDAIIYDDNSKKLIEKIIQENNLEIITVELEQKYLSIYNEVFKPLASLNVNEKDVATAFFTRGNNNNPPKLVAFSHETIKQIVKMNRACLKLSPADRIYTTFNFSHFFGLVSVALTALQSGACILFPQILLEKELLFEFFNQESLSALFVLPLELNHFVKNIQEKNINKISKAFITDGKMNEFLENFYKYNTDSKLFEIYGCLEAGWTISLNKDNEDYCFGSQGSLFPGTTAKLVLEDGITENTTGAGRLAIKNSFMMSGYFDELFDIKEPIKVNKIQTVQEIEEKEEAKKENEKETQEQVQQIKRTFIPNSWFLTDDFVEIDSNGILYYVDKVSQKESIDTCLKERQKKGLDKKKTSTGIDIDIQVAKTENVPEIKKLLSLIYAEQNSNIIIHPVGGYGLTALYNKQVVGFIQAHTLWVNNDYTKHVCAIECYVINKLRRKGIASRLMKKILPELSKKGFSQIINIISTGNLAGAAFLKHMGFYEKGKLNNFYKINENLISVTLFEKSTDFNAYT